MSGNQFPWAPGCTVYYKFDISDATVAAQFKTFTLQDGVVAVVGFNLLTPDTGPVQTVFSSAMRAEVRAASAVWPAIVNPVPGFHPFPGMSAAAGGTKGISVVMNEQGTQAEVTLHWK